MPRICISPFGMLPQSFTEILLTSSFREIAWKQNSDTDDAKTIYSSPDSFISAGDNYIHKELKSKNSSDIDNAIFQKNVKYHVYMYV